VKGKGKVENEIGEKQRKKMKIGSETEIAESWKITFPTFSKEKIFFP